MRFNKPEPEPRRLERITAAFRFDYLTQSGKPAFVIYEGEGWSNQEARRKAGDRFLRDYPRLRNDSPPATVQVATKPAGVLAHERTR